MVNEIMFNRTSDIQELTGLPDRNALWDAGFNLDDWEAGFCSDQKLHEEETYEDDDEEYTEIHWIDDDNSLGPED